MKCAAWNPFPQAQDFLTLAALPQAEFTLNALDTGVFGDSGCTLAPAVGQICSPAGSPLSFVNTPDGTLVFYSLEGTAIDSNTLLQTAFDGTVASEFAGESYQSLLGTLATDGTLNASYSTEIAAGPFSQGKSVPEPEPLTLFGLGLAAIGLSRRGRRVEAFH